MNLDHIRSRTTTSADGCWIWQGALIRGRPYLSVHEDGVRYNRRVQKVVLQLTGTSVPQWAHISQGCGNPLCCKSYRLSVCVSGNIAPHAICHKACRECYRRSGAQGLPACNRNT